MPDVIIKGMEKMPIACCECPCESGNICAAENKRPTFEEWSKCKPDWCPLRPVPEWRSTITNPPKPGQTVAFYGIGEAADGGMLTDNMDITHWMPFPEPPKGGDGDAIP